MKSPRLLRSPFLWILAAFLLIILGMNLFSASSRYQQVPTSKVIEVIQGNDALREVVLVDGDQEIRVEYKGDGGARMRANWVGQQSLQIVDRLNERSEAGTLDQWRVENPDRGFMSLFHSDKPVVCKVHGFCVAGGTDMALCSDLLVIADDAASTHGPRSAA